ncbi:hypothetical protein KXX19_004010 [Aspergillus fumigatus]|nr:hypothetical protein KXX19_004010 [Aspergillus fumigatus]
MGQLFMMGFDGTSVNPQIRSLIENYHLGSVLLTAKNLKSAEEATRLVLELQTIARDAGHPVPLLIALDQENGGVNSLYDEIYIRQFPSAMGIAATGSKSLAYDVAYATAQELKAVGVNWILGPVLDVLTNVRTQPLGVRTTGDDPQEVSQYGVEFMKGYKKAGLVTCGKHFPSYGNLEFLGSQTDVPIITESLEQLSLTALVPFRNAIVHGLDSMMVGGVSMSSAGVNVMHACLSEQVVDDLLRKDLKFNGVVVSECLEMEALTHNIGVGGGTVMAKNAGYRTASVLSGESVFKELGRSLSRQRSGRVLHTSYTANGVRPIHENLIDRASAVIVVTADANRNLYQHGFTKYVSLICRSQFSPSGEPREKPMIVIAASSPYDFAMDTSIGTYVCTYDFTETALEALVKVLYGELTPKGSLPGSISRSQKLHQARQHWLVENWNEERDAQSLDTLLDAVRADCAQGQRSELLGVTSSSFLLRSKEIDEAHFVVRNSSTQALYVFCSTYFFRSTGTGVIGSLIVDPARRKLSIGNSLHNRAIRTLLQRKGMRRFQLGSRLPGIYLGIPSSNPVERKRLRQWFANLGWNTALSRPVCSVVLRNLPTWTPPDGLIQGLKNADVSYDLVHGWDYAEPILDHIKTNSRQGLIDIYKIALGGAPNCGIIRAMRPSDGAILGTVVIYNGRSSLAEHVPVLKATQPSSGGISSPFKSPLSSVPIIPFTPPAHGLGLHLDLQYVNSLSFQVDGDSNFDCLSGMGFSMLHSFEEVNCDAATWTMMPTT